MFVDIHHHLIYGIDDGAQSFAGTEKMIRHAPFPMEDYLKHLQETREYLDRENIDLTLYTGSEALYTPSTPYQLSEGKVPTLAGTRYVLIEFSPDDTYKYLTDAAGAEALDGAWYTPRAGQAVSDGG